MRKIGSIIVVLAALTAPARADVVHFGSNDFVAVAGDDSSAEHVVVVRSTRADGGSATYVAYDRAALLEVTDSGYVVELVQGFGEVPSGALAAGSRRATLDVAAAAIGVTAYTLACDFDGFCTTIDEAAVTGTLHVVWTAQGSATRDSGTRVEDAGGVTIRISGTQTVVDAPASGSAFGSALSLPGNLSSGRSSYVQIER